MRYYYQGVCSWQWFYPYHYAPFASDLTDLDELEITFFPGKPFKPFDQLMGVLPAASADALPKQYRCLMTDPNSPIIDFYPPDFEIDMNGKRRAWQGVAKLPFIDEYRLLAETRKLEGTLTDDEFHRNSERIDMLFVRRTHPLSELLLAFLEKCAHLKGHQQLNSREIIDPLLSGGMNGFVAFFDNSIWVPFFSSPVSGMPSIPNNQVLSALYRPPASRLHISKLPDGVNIPAKVVTKEDIKFQPLWHEEVGRRGFNQERPPVRNSISGVQLSGAAHRLISNTLQQKPMNTENVVQILQRQGSQGATPAVGGILGLPSQLQQPNSFSTGSQGRAQPAGPPGYEDGFSSIHTNIGSWESVPPFLFSHSAQVQGAATYQASSTIYQGNGFSSPKSHRRTGPAVPHGQGFMGRGGGQIHDTPQSSKVQGFTFAPSSAASRPYQWGGIYGGSQLSGPGNSVSPSETKRSGRGRGMGNRRDFYG
ncbi:hypothetical protein L7F22_067693 [Adiantum nelumboides]|nr:hypothetical protein [Adiantum nelumboides]